MSRLRAAAGRIPSGLFFLGLALADIGLRYLTLN